MIITYKYYNNTNTDCDNNVLFIIDISFRLRIGKYDNSVKIVQKFLSNVEVILYE